MARVPNTNRRTSNTAPLPPTQLAALEQRIRNLERQRTILTSWKTEAVKEWRPYGGDAETTPNYGQKYVALNPTFFFHGPNGADPRNLPNTALVWPGKDEGKWFVFKDIPHIIQEYGQNRIIFVSEIDKAIGLWSARLGRLLAQKLALTGTDIQGSRPAPTGPAAPPPDTTKYTYISKRDLDNQPLLVNVGSVKEAYFTVRSQAEDAMNAMVDRGLRGPDGRPLIRQSAVGLNDKLGTNAPSPISDASELWFSAAGSKGMFQTLFPDSGASIEEMEENNIYPVNTSLQKYGFQFMYNPNTINMNYLGVADTDVARQASGLSKTNYIPNPGTTGGITFNILINRMFDMQYYRPIQNGRAELLPGAESLYSPRAPYNKETGTALGLFDEQSVIYNKGTMYDIEYLLRTIMGFTMKSQLRREFTADMGLFSRKPLDLHLGPKMRYRGYISGINVSHTIFNERMVPVLSSVSLSFNRYPDYTSAVDPNARSKDS